MKNRLKNIGAKYDGFTPGYPIYNVHALISNYMFSERANLVDLAVDELLGTGVRVVAVTCDSPKVQLSMMKCLGADLNVDNPDLQICKDKGSTPIYFIHDMCHVLKLVRNAWHHHKLILNADKKVIDWSYVQKIYDLQSLEHSKCVNKLTSNHVFSIM